MLTTSFTLSTMNLDGHDRLTLTSILDFAAEAAGRDASSLHVGFKDFERLGYYWVLARVRLVIKAFPDPEGEVRVTTWPQKLLRERMAYREFRFTDERSHVLVEGESTWCVIDRATRLFVPFPEVFKTVLQESEVVLPGDWERLPDARGIRTATHVVRPTEIDHNGHFNNAQYARVLLDALDLGPDEVPAAFAISFEHELKKGETMNMLIDPTDTGYLAKGVRSDGLTAFKARIINAS